jgi:hypothetical protein
MRKEVEDADEKQILCRTCKFFIIIELQQQQQMENNMKER